MEARKARRKVANDFSFRARRRVSTSSTAPFHVVIRNETKRAFATPRLERRIVTALRVLGYRRPVTVYLTIVEPGRMRQLNRTWRKKDRSTTVLAFPLESPKDHWFSVPVLGEVFLCPQEIVRSAAVLNISPDEAVEKFLVHGIMHCAGYDHERISDARAMEALEERILARKRSSR